MNRNRIIVGTVILVAVSCVCVWLTVRPKPKPTQIVWSNSNLEWKVGDAKLCEFKPMLDGSGKVLVCDERDALFEWYEDAEQGISPSFLDSSSRHDVLVTFHGQKASGWKCRRLSDSFECSRANITIGKRPNGLTVISEGDDREVVPTPAMRGTTATTSEVAATEQVPDSVGADFAQMHDPVFHGLKLGSPLNAQLPKCETRLDEGKEIVLGKGLCYLSRSFAVDEGTGTAYVEIRRGGQNAEEPPACDAVAGKCTFREHIIVHLLPADSREQGTIESVSSSYPPERLDEMRYTLDMVYGSPVNKNGWIHYPKPWGRVKLTNWNYEVSVEAQTTRLVDLIEKSARRTLESQ
jgi:hypothetical protein